MSSSGRFQSYLFNFVSQQTRKLADKISLGLRHFKVGTIWGTQILLYPVYALFQSTRLVGRQLQQVVRLASRLPRQLSSLSLGESPPQSADDAQFSVDAPIQQVLTAIRGNDRPEQMPRSGQGSFFDRLLAGVSRFSQRGLTRLKPQPSNCTAQMAPSVEALLPLSSVPIQGIASLLPTGKLVLVTTDNQIMDVLSLKQQEQLRQRIIWELANYWRYWRQHFLGSSLRLPPIEDRPMLLPAVRLFWQLMAWVQNGPVAIAANLFQESTLVAQPSAELVWFTPTVTLPTFDLAHFSPPSIPTRSDFKTLIKKMPTVGEMEALIWAAIRYFFGQGNPKSSASHRVAGTQEPWLTSTDVFGNPVNRLSGLSKAESFALSSRLTPSILKGNSANAQIGKTFQPVAHLPAQAESIQGDSKTLVLPFQPQIQQTNSIWKWINRYLSPQRQLAQGRPAKSAHLVKRQPASHPLTQVKPGTIDRPTQRVSHLTAPTKAFAHELTQPSTQTVAHSSSEPDWIETPATSIGYVKHPLQRIIGWLDNAVAWIEKTLIGLWNRLLARQ